MRVFKNLLKSKKNTHSDISQNTIEIDLNNVPEHIAISMDGNGRWARQKGKPRTFGNQAGAETLKTILKASEKIGVKVISAYAFSTENWKRPITEVNFIMELLGRYLTSEIDEFNVIQSQLKIRNAKILSESV